MRAPPAIYVDLDDVLSDTVAGLLRALEELHGRVVRFEAVHDFDLSESFGLGRAELAGFMREVHRPERLLALAVRGGAARALDAWRERGYAVALVTGRPPHTRDASQRWLARHGIAHESFHCVDKYARHERGAASLSLDALARMRFALAVEDSLEMAVFLAERLALPVALMDRPWNRRTEGVAPRSLARITRVRDWHELAARFPAP